MMKFSPFPKIARLSREMVITEKLDGTNASIFLGENGEFLTASRTRWITPQDDNFGFAAWAHDNKNELLRLGPGHHFGEWWGRGIQRNYGQKERHFSLFNVHRWADPEARPACCQVVPQLCRVLFSSSVIENVMLLLKENGSAAAPGFMNPEGVMIYHTAARTMFKKTFDHDEEGKGQ